MRSAANGPDPFSRIGKAALVVRCRWNKCTCLIIFYLRSGKTWRKVSSLRKRRSFTTHVVLMFVFNTSFRRYFSNVLFHKVFYEKKQKIESKFPNILIVYKKWQSTSCPFQIPDPSVRSRFVFCYFALGEKSSLFNRVFCFKKCSSIS